MFAGSGTVDLPWRGPTFLETITRDRFSPKVIIPAPMGLEEVLGHEKSLRVENQIWKDAPPGIMTPAFGCNGFGPCVRSTGSV
jgi:hypothetical protein